MLDEALSCNIIQHNAETVKQSKQRIIERNPPRKIYHHHNNDKCHCQSKFA